MVRDQAEWEQNVHILQAHEDWVNEFLDGGEGRCMDCGSYEYREMPAVENEECGPCSRGGEGRLVADTPVEGYWNAEEVTRARAAQEH
jgi:hypothetical protein